MKKSALVTLFHDLMKYAVNFEDKSNSINVDNFCVISFDGNHLLRDILDMQDGLIIGLRSLLTSNDANVNSNIMLPTSESSDNDMTLKAENNLDITGTPLECPFDLNDDTLPLDENSPTDFKTNDALKNSLPINEAIWFMNVIRDFLEEPRSSDEIIRSPIVLQCDGGDIAGTLFLGFQKHIDGGLRRFRVTCSHDVLSANQLDTFDDVQRNHLFGISHKNVETEAKATYRILERSDVPALNKKYADAGSNIELIYDWTNVERVLESPNANSTCTVVFDVAMGDIRSQAYSKFCELSLLEDLANGLKTGEITWKPADPNKSAFVAVTELLDSMRLGTGGPSGRSSFETMNHGSGLDDVESESFTMSRSRNMDFTDKLWSILNGCGSYDELVKSLNFVLDAVAVGGIKPVIFSSNHTSFSEILLDIIHRRTTKIPRLTGVAHLRALVEMGIEKLKQDYACILLGSDLLTRDSLKPFFRRDHDKSNNNSRYYHHKHNDNKGTEGDNDWERDLIALRKLHCVVELIALCHTFVGSSHTLLTNYARNALDKLIAIEEVKRSHSFTFAINWKAVKPIQEKFFPVVWQMRLVSRQMSCYVQTVYRLSVEHPIISDVLLKREKLDSDNIDNTAGPFYVCKSSLVHGLF